MPTWFASKSRSWTWEVPSSSSTRRRRTRTPDFPRTSPLAQRDDGHLCGPPSFLKGTHKAYFVAERVLRSKRQSWMGLRGSGDVILQEVTSSLAGDVPAGFSSRAGPQRRTPWNSTDKSRSWPTSLLHVPHRLRRERRPHLLPLPSVGNVAKTESMVIDHSKADTRAGQALRESAAVLGFGSSSSGNKAGHGFVAGERLQNSPINPATPEPSRKHQQQQDVTPTLELPDPGLKGKERENQDWESGRCVALEDSGS